MEVLQNFIITKNYNLNQTSTNERDCAESGNEDNWTIFKVIMQIRATYLCENKTIVVRKHRESFYKEPSFCIRSNTSRT